MRDLATNLQQSDLPSGLAILDGTNTVQGYTVTHGVPNGIGEALMGGSSATSVDHVPNKSTVKRSGMDVNWWRPRYYPDLAVAVVNSRNGVTTFQLNQPQTPNSFQVDSIRYRLGLNGIMGEEKPTRRNPENGPEVSLRSENGWFIATARTELNRDNRTQAAGPDFAVKNPDQFAILLNGTASMELAFMKPSKKVDC